MMGPMRSHSPSLRPSAGCPSRWCGRSGSRARIGGGKTRLGAQPVDYYGRDVSKNRDYEDQQSAAHEVTSEWVSLVTSVALALDPETSPPVNRALKDAILSLDRSLILFLCGGERGSRDDRDIQPADFLGRDWYPTDDEMDQRLRGRLGVISKLRAHLTWHRATSNDAVIWPLGLLAWETSWTMGEFIAELRTEGTPALAIFELAEAQVRSHLPDDEFRAATSEYAKARPGQVQHGRRGIRPSSGLAFRHEQ